EGCDNTCNFCAIPLFRGKHKSRPKEDLIEQTRKYAGKGVKEINLISQHLDYYGQDLYGEKLLPSLIRAGFDIINPVQCSATGMDPRHLKQAYGRDLVFWGGGVDTQHTLPFGTPDQVRAEVRERLRLFSPDGGFVFNSIHNIQARTPLPNILAMLEAVRAFNAGD
ncbi:MAG: radical SAM protein, partial [Opitutales bacterium]|nr:radical SAM protein [Opitutales bacterium]